MICEHCGKKVVKPIQESKDDYWKCSCGDYHLGFPYECPKKHFSWRCTCGIINFYPREKVCQCGLGMSEKYKC